MLDELVLHLPVRSPLAAQWDEFVRTCFVPLPVSRSRRWWFLAATAFIATVSLYDAYLVVAYQVCMAHVELNPVCWYLIKLNGNDVSLMLHAKAIGTIGVMLVLTYLYLAAPRLAFPVVNSVALFQAGLLAFLHFA